MIPVAFLFMAIWPRVQSLIAGMQSFFISSGALGIWVYTFCERILIPTGLHHFIYMPMAYESIVVEGGFKAAWALGLPEFAKSTESLSTLFPAGGFALYGHSKVFAPIGIGAAFYVTAKPNKKKEVLGLMLPVALTAAFAGITEPALYGVTLRLKRPMLGACIGGAVGGLVGGFFQMKCFGIATPAIVTIVQYVEKGKPQTLLFAALTILVTVVVTFVATLIIGFEDIVDEDDDLDFVEESNAQLLDNEISITSPVEGKVIPLTEVKDPTFSQEILGKGAAIIPEKGVVYAPFDGKVDAVFETGHALGLVSEDGVELLVHVGIDTVNLKGKYFTPKKKSGDTMKKGDILLEFDIDKIKADGYDVTTPIIISNTEQFAKVKACEDKVVTKESKLLSVQ